MQDLEKFLYKSLHFTPNWHDFFRQDWENAENDLSWLTIISYLWPAYARKLACTIQAVVFVEGWLR